MQRPYGPAISLAFAACFLAASCERTPACDYDATASDDGQVRLALLVDTSSEPGEGLAELARRLKFPQSNICTLTAGHATADAVRTAVDEILAQGGANAIRFVAIAADGAIVVDDNADEPDEYDETILFADADNAGGGEVRDDELHTWLDRIRSASASSLVVLNVGVYSAAHDQASNPATRYGLPRSRSLGDKVRDGGDSAASLRGGGGPNHVVLAAGPAGAGARFDSVISRLLEELDVHTPTYEQLAKRFALRMYADGLDPDAGGSGNANVFELHKQKLVPLGLGDATITVGAREHSHHGAPSEQQIEELARIVESIEGAALASGDVLPDFELSRREDGVLVLRGPGGRARNTAESMAELAGILRGHLVQRRLADLRGNDDERLPDQQTLDVMLRRYSQQLPCARGAWDPAPVDGVQDIPLCFAWYSEVENTNNQTPLFITALILSSDGSTLVIPGTAASAVTGRTSFASGDQVIGAGPPVDVVDTLLVIGSTEPIDVNGLLRGGAAAPAGSQWTISTRFFRTVANSAFVDADELTQREYTIKNFDIRPYVPDDDTTALSKFLRLADQLARSSIEDGYSYKQHGWRHDTDEENLAKGIDCSRSIWFAFTRSGLPYNDNNDQYLATADMVTADSRMADEFDACPLDEDYQIGDILVYRSDKRGDGHVVAVIDLDKRIAWGSHGWDGNVKAGLALEPDTGVEYQKIRVKRDWQRWDRSDMTLRKCWRYRRFAEEIESGRATAGSRILNVTCSERECQL